MSTERYAIRGGREGYDRLQLLARALWPDTAALFDRVGLRSGLRCLELGCGGAVTLEIARRVGPDGHAVGMDMDEVKLDLAREVAKERGFSNLEFLAMNVNDWNEPGAYDIVYCRNLLQHLSRPVELLKKMWAAVKPGGAIIVEDVDFDGLFCDPPNDGFEFLLHHYHKVLERYGGDAAIGRKLHRYFHDASIPNPHLSLTQRVNTVGETKTLMLSTLEATAGSMLQDALATEAEIDAALASLRAFTDDPQTVISRPRVFQFWRRR